ncbi:MAG: type II secretion system protein [Rickettsiales bacterium]
MRKIKGFTLVELSIVIVIIGFLVAAITSGASMIKQAEMRSVINDLQSFRTAYNNFIAAYGAVPGDMVVASSYWPNGACAQTDSNCNGNGNGLIEATTTNAEPDEVRGALKQLALAGMINAGIPQIPDAIIQLVPGVNAPASKLSDAGYYYASSAYDTQVYQLPLDPGVNYIFLGGYSPVSGAHPLLNFLYTGALTPMDAFSIDYKMDDGIILSYNDNLFDALLSNVMAANPAHVVSNFGGGTTGKIRGCDAYSYGYGGCVYQGTYDVVENFKICGLAYALN